MSTNQDESQAQLANYQYILEIPQKKQIFQVF